MRMTSPVQARNLPDDPVSLAPLRAFLRAVRGWLGFGFAGLMVTGLVLIGVIWKTTPTISYGSLGISMNFLGAQKGEYPNRLPFSPEDLLSRSVLRPVYAKHRLQDFCSFENFEAGLSIRQDGRALEALDREYGDRLADSKVLGPERLRLQEEFKSRMETAQSTEYQLIWVQPGRNIPPDLQAKVLEDIPRTWAEEAVQVKRVLEFPVPLPNARAPFDLEYASANLLGAFDQLAERAGSLGAGLGAIASLPGANQASLPDGVGLIDLQIRHRSFVEQDLEAFENRILFQQGAAAETLLIQEALTFQIRSREEELELAQRRVEVLTRSLDDYLLGRRLKNPPAEKPSAPAEPTPEAAETSTLEDRANSEIPLLGRLEEVATLQQEQAYRKNFIEKITRAREDASLKQARLEESRRNIFLVKKAVVAPSLVASPAKTGATTDPGADPGLASSPFPPLDPLEFAAVWNQLNDLIGKSVDLVAVISRNYLGEKVVLYTVSRPFEQGQVAGIEPARLALGLAVWGLLGSAILLAVLGSLYRVKILSQSLRAPSPA